MARVLGVAGYFFAVVLLLTGAPKVLAEDIDVERALKQRILADPSIATVVPQQRLCDQISVDLSNLELVSAEVKYGSSVASPYQLADTSEEKLFVPNCSTVPLNETMSFRLKTKKGHTVTNTDKLVNTANVKHSGGFKISGEIYDVGLELTGSKEESKSIQHDVTKAEQTEAVTETEKEESRDFTIPVNTIFISL